MEKNESINLNKSASLTIAMLSESDLMNMYFIIMNIQQFWEHNTDINCSMLTNK